MGFCLPEISSPKATLPDAASNSFGRQIIHDFDTLPITDEKKPRVGVVGEILVKFLPAANNYLVDLLEHEGAEAVVPDLADFLLYCFYNTNFKHTHLGMKKSSARLANLGISVLEWFRKPAVDAYKKGKRFTPPSRIEHLASMASEIVSLGNQTGEGWFLTGEMLELIENGARNIVCTQPFACLPNHVVGKGVIKELRRLHPESNIVAIDYDPGASEVNQLNRIKLMLSTANKNSGKMISRRPYDRNRDLFIKAKDRSRSVSSIDTSGGLFTFQSSSLSLRRKMLYVRYDVSAYSISYRAYINFKEGA